MCERTVWRICSENDWWSRFSKKRAKNSKTDPLAHDDLVKRVLAAGAPNRSWLTDITEQSIGEGKLYLCAIKDVIANRIVGYFIDSRMKSRLAVDALGSATAHRAAEGTSVAGCIVHADRGSRFRSRKFVAAQNRHGLVGSVGEVGASGDNTAMPVSQVGAQPLTTIRLVGVESQQLLGTVAHRACLCLSGPQVKGAR